MELLAPAGSPEALTAAVQSGADAVYLGCGDFNARRSAKNFAPEDLAPTVAYCHLRGVKVYLTLNTLLTDRELKQAADVAREASRAGVDAVLVQDLGVAKLLRDTAPDLPLHASTQMTVHDLDGVKACAQLGMTRVVLSRELSKTAIADLCESSPIELEVFAHGALCMCYSGQCYLSAVLGGRSGNRGLCAQPCRLAFRWPGEKKDSRPLSLKDLSLAEELRELKDMGVACVKIEGRRRRPEYVAVVTAVYAAALKENRLPTPEELARLEAAFSRQGFTKGYYRDQTGPAMFGSRPEGTKDPEDLFAQARDFYSRGEHRTVPVTVTAKIKGGEPFTVTARDPEGHEAAARGDVPEPARTRELTGPEVEKQLAKTGGTVFRAEQVTAEVEAGLSLPTSAINALRRQVLEDLAARRTDLPKRRELPFSAPEKAKNSGETTKLTLSVRRFTQLSPALLDQGPAIVYLPCQLWSAHEKDLADLTRRYPDIAFGVTFPRVAWDREKAQLRKELTAAKTAGATQALLGHIGQLALAREFGFTPRGDFGLGLVNSFTARELHRLGFASATLSFEGKLAQLRDLEKPLDTELMVYGRLPLMLTENCILENRGKGCHCEESPQVLRDRKGEDLPVEKAWGCRNEIFNPHALWLADKKADWSRVGAAYARLSFLRETPEECADIFAAYRAGREGLPEGCTRGLYYRGVE